VSIKIVRCALCDQMIAASHMTRHQDGLECIARAAAGVRRASGWTQLPKGPGVRAAFDAAAVIRESDYNGTFQRGGPGRRAHAPTALYVAAWAAAVWVAIAASETSPKRKQTRFVACLSNPDRANVLAVQYALTKSVDPALFIESL